MAGYGSSWESPVSRRFDIAVPGRAFKVILPARQFKRSCPARNFTNVLPEREFKKVIPKRDFLQAIPERNFLVALPRRKLGNIMDNRFIGFQPLAFEFWGQTNIRPFKHGGVDFSKTFADLL